MSDVDIDEMSSLSLHPDDALRKKSSEISPDRKISHNCGDRSRTSSKDSTSFQDPELVYQRFLEGEICGFIEQNVLSMLIHSHH